MDSNGNVEFGIANPDCHECGGTGEVKTCDWVPYGSTNVPLYGAEVCNCVEWFDLDANDVKALVLKLRQTEAELERRSAQVLNLSARLAAETTITY